MLFLWLALGWLPISVLLGLVVGAAIRLQGSGDSSCAPPSRGAAGRTAGAEATTGDRAGRRPRVAADG